MQASSGNIWDALESLSYLWLILSAEALLVSGQEGKLSWLMYALKCKTKYLFYLVNCYSHLFITRREF